MLLPTQYPEAASQCAEILRVALPRMTRQAAGAHPVSYAVWFEYALGRNPRLNQQIEKLTRDGAVLDDAATWNLYREHVAGISEQQAQQMADDIRQVVAQVSESAKAAGAQTHRFGDSLARFSHSVDQGQLPDSDVLQDVLAHTSDMRRAMDNLQTELQASQKEIERLRCEVDRARVEALVDALTGLPNRRAFEQALLSLPLDSHSCVVVADIDHFKRINDSYGHLFGDTVLKVVAQALMQGVAKPQLAARIGGEEFAILVPGQAADAAQALAERLRTAIAACRIRRKGSQESIGQVTVSLGLAQRRMNENAEDWLQRADQALYTSKAGGRNRVSVATN